MSEPTKSIKVTERAYNNLLKRKYETKNKKTIMQIIDDLVFVKTIKEAVK